jgi:hypothetical protein
MKFVSRRKERASLQVAPVAEGFSGLLRNWAQSLYDKAHDPSHCSRCGVYLPARDRICGPCTREAERFADQPV